MLITVCFPTFAASELQDKIFSKAKETKSMTSVFIQKRQLSVLPLPLVSKGTFRYHHETGIVWETQEPIQSRIIITKRGIQTEDKYSGTKTEGSSQLSEILLSFFSGDSVALERYFSIRVKGNAKQWNLLLEPINNLVAAQIALISIEGRESVESLYIVESSGDYSNLEFSSSRVDRLSKKF